MWEIGSNNYRNMVKARLCLLALLPVDQVPFCPTRLYSKVQEGSDGWPCVLTGKMLLVG